MKKLKDYLFSMLSSVVLLILFGASIAYATFVESSKGSEYARELIYNAKWFEVLLVLLIINLVGSVFRYNLVNRRKWSVLLFHLAFILMILGAAITRYTGFEGMMHIRQGETSDEISTEKLAVNITAEYNGENVSKSTVAKFSESGLNTFSEVLQIGGKTITVENEMYIPNAIETIVPDAQGDPAISLFVMNRQNQGNDFILSSGEIGEVETVSFAFGASNDNADIHFFVADDQLFLKSEFPFYKMQMMQKEEIELQPKTVYAAETKTIYKVDNLVFVLKAYIPKARRNLVQATNYADKTGMAKQGKDAFIFKISDGTGSKRVNVLGSGSELSQPSSCMLNNVYVSVAYGAYFHKLPFSITLREFKLDRYPGSNSPSSYSSEITVIDNEMKSVRPFRIYMNNILNYRGYRFFQSSYDQDEKGTVLQVSHDYWGTLVTYIGYFLMMLGMVLTLVNKNSRFRTVLNLSNQLQQKRKTLKAVAIVGLLFMSNSLFALPNGGSKAEHIKQLNSLLIQDEAQGRIEPLSTYASDVVRKISKQSTYKKLSAVDVFLGAVSNPAVWENEPFIKVGNDQLAKELGAINGYVSFNQLFDFENENKYRLQDLVEAVYHKEPTLRNKYDKEILNVDERINICYRLFNGEMFSIFPMKGSTNGKWSSVSVDLESGSGAHQQGCPYSGMTAKPDAMSAMGQHSMHGSVDAPTQNDPEKLLSTYFDAVNNAMESNNWSAADRQLAAIKSYQLINGGNNLPSANKVRLEIAYNNLNIFSKLAIIYVLLGFVMLVFHLINIFKFSITLDKRLGFAIYPFLLLFVIYSAGLMARWYISDHAPWSNGYETMLFVGWAASLSGLLFARKSQITLAITAVLSAIALFVAGMSWMNPEITNLVPVLKSYWLIVHVAIITSSYGFLAMGALLGFLNLVLMIARSKRKSEHINDSIQEISYIIEMALILGLVMLTIGCFIGGIWANESWGRYWGWDPKETWALVSILVYTAILHLRNVPKANNQFVLSSLALVGFSTIVMTFFGVNYYLSGMHSYAQGTPPPIPVAIYFVIVGIVALIAAAYYAERKPENGNRVTR